MIVYWFGSFFESPAFLKGFPNKVDYVFFVEMFWEVVYLNIPFAGVLRLSLHCGPNLFLYLSIVSFDWFGWISKSLDLKREKD